MLNASWPPLLAFLKYHLDLDEEDRKLVEARTPKLPKDECITFHIFRKVFGERIISIVNSCGCPRWEEDMVPAANCMKDLKQDGVDIETLMQQGVELSKETCNIIKSIMAPLQKDPKKRFNSAGTYKRPSDEKLGKGAIQQLETKLEECHNGKGNGILMEHSTVKAARTIEGGKFLDDAFDWKNEIKLVPEDDIGLSLIPGKGKNPFLMLCRALFIAFAVQATLKHRLRALRVLSVMIQLQHAAVHLSFEEARIAQLVVFCHGNYMEKAGCRGGRCSTD